MPNPEVIWNRAVAVAGALLGSESVHRVLAFGDTATRTSTTVVQLIAVATEEAFDRFRKETIEWSKPEDDERDPFPWRSARSMAVRTTLRDDPTFDMEWYNSAYVLGATRQELTSSFDFDVYFFPEDWRTRWSELIDAFPYLDRKKLQMIEDTARMVQLLG